MSELYDPPLITRLARHPRYHTHLVLIGVKTTRDFERRPYLIFNGTDTVPALHVLTPALRRRYAAHLSADTVALLGNAQVMTQLTAQEYAALADALHSQMPEPHAHA